VRKGASKAQEAVTVGPKRLKGAKLIDATVKAGGEGFRFVEQQKGEKASDLAGSPAAFKAPKKEAPAARSPASWKSRKPKAGNWAGVRV
jgi:hypothetical protein